MRSESLLPRALCGTHDPHSSTCSLFRPPAPGRARWRGRGHGWPFCLGRVTSFQGRGLCLVSMNTSWKWRPPGRVPGSRRLVQLDRGQLGHLSLATDVLSILPAHPGLCSASVPGVLPKGPPGRTVSRGEVSSQAVSPGGETEAPREEQPTPAHLGGADGECELKPWL